MIGRAARGAGALIAVALLASAAPTTGDATSLVAATADNDTVATARPSTIHVALKPIVSGFTQPVGVANAHDGSHRLFVLEEAGTVRVVSGHTIQPDPYLDISSEVVAGSGGGLMSIAFHPHFASTPYLYVAYSRGDALQVSRFRATDAAATSIDPATETPIITVTYRAGSQHIGSQLVFGPGGLLFISTGDGVNPGDPDDVARSMSSLRGKILRIDVDRQCGTRNYCIPSTNPPVGPKHGRRAIFDWGLRNPWRMSYNGADRTLWIGDVGQDDAEEIDHVPAAGGYDFGWSCMEGSETYLPDRCAGRTLTPPLRTYQHDDIRCAVIGGYVYRGWTYPFARGLYVYGDFCSGELWAIGRDSKGGYRRDKVGGAGRRLNSFGESGSGELYAVRRNGTLYHLVFEREQ